MPNKYIYSLMPHKNINSLKPNNNEYKQSHVKQIYINNLMPKNKNINK